jgi:hypothetical protein
MSIRGLVDAEIAVNATYSHVLAVPVEGKIVQNSRGVNGNRADAASPPYR